MDRGTIRLEDVVSTISKEYLLDFTSEYGAAKVSHFEINCHILNIIPTLNLFRVFYVPSYNTGWMSFSKRPDMDLFNLISAPNPTKVKTGTRPRAAHEVSLLTATASRVIDMEDTAIASGSSGTPPALKKSPLDSDD
nr:hypothetical protein [Tanacetum cinerariifolium]